MKLMKQPKKEKIFMLKILKNKLEKIGKNILSLIILWRSKIIESQKLFKLSFSDVASIETGVSRMYNLEKDFFKGAKQCTTNIVAHAEKNSFK